VVLKSLPRRGRLRLWGAASLLWLCSCGDLQVVTNSYATLDEAVAAGAVAQGTLPPRLPPGSHDIRAAHDRDSPRRWGLFEFPPAQAGSLHGILGPEIAFEGLRVNPPRRIEWWPLLLRGPLDEAQLRATGLQVYEAREGNLILAVNWKQGRAYYWVREN
jgi:hypothetical protein